MCLFYYGGMNVSSFLMVWLETQKSPNSAALIISPFSIPSPAPKTSTLAKTNFLESYI